MNIGKFHLPALIILRDTEEDAYGPRFPTKEAIGFSTSSDRDAPLKSPILFFGAYFDRWRASAGRNILGSPVFVNH
jgi:hypothetical protein